MNSKNIRKQFIDFFLDKDHRFVRSSSVAPNDDPTLLFTNAGMNQFKDIFLGLKKPDYARAVNSQKCIRVSGKHNDLEEVGVDNFHHTFFEMLGNWSFGDYYKEESIKWAWELFTKHWKLDRERLWITIYKDDDESYDIWSKIDGLDTDRILRFGNKDNFWEMGETGPCGPCSEIHYYTGKDSSRQNPEGVNIDSEYRELWNLVFIQYNRESDKSLNPLPLKHVDTGMGLERIASVLNNVQDHYLLDIFKGLTEKTVELSGKDYNFREGVPHRVIADHIRMLSFSIADGAVPSNDGRGYVLRRVLRRAVRYGDLLGIKEPFLGFLVDDLISLMGSAYPEVRDKKEHIKATLEREEVLFRNTLERGLVKFEEFAHAQKEQNELKGKDAFKLYDTYGFPLDLTKLMCDERGLSVDEKGFSSSMEKQKKSSRDNKKFKNKNMKFEWITKSHDLKSVFLGYTDSEVNTSIKAYHLEEDVCYLILKETPFYYESGGQVSDIGEICSDNFKISVVDVQKINDCICHIGKLKEGQVGLDSVTARIDIERRKKIMSNHTATHMLHESLKQILGKHVQQSGSLVDPDKLRFDYTHSDKMTQSQLNEIEFLVNSNIQNNLKIETDITDYDKAIKGGAVGLFGEKYEDDVRVVEIPSFSKELCGGTHVARTGDIGLFKIISETSLSSGVRRIEALTGLSCLEYLQSYYRKMKLIELDFKCDKDSVLDVIDNLKKQNIDIIKKNEILQAGNQAGILDDLILKAEKNNKFKLICSILNSDVDENILSDQFRGKVKSKGVMLLGIIKNEKPMIVCSVTDDLTDKYNASDIVKIAAKYIDGGGGGKSHFAKAGGKNKDFLEKAILETKNRIFG